MKEALEQLKYLTIKSELPPENDIIWKRVGLENLQKLDDQGLNFFHHVCAVGNIKQIPLKYLTQENLSLKDREGNNCFHILAARGKILELPKEFLTKDNLRKKNNMGMTSYHAGTICNPGYGSIPISLWDDIDTKTQEFTLGKTPMHLSAKHKFRGIPRELVTQETLSLIDHEGTTVLHEAIRNNGLNSIPKSLLTPELLLKKNRLGISPVQESYLKHIPFEGQEKSDPTILKLMDVEQLEYVKAKIREQTIKELYQKELKKRMIKIEIGTLGMEKTLEI
jgi:hypothetical protein